jgi:hypothetical protein
VTQIPGQGEADQRAIRGTICPPNGLRYAVRDGSNQGAVL